MWFANGLLLCYGALDNDARVLYAEVARDRTVCFPAFKLYVLQHFLRMSLTMQNLRARDYNASFVVYHIRALVQTIRPEKAPRRTSPEPTYNEDVALSLRLYLASPYVERITTKADAIPLGRPVKSANGHKVSQLSIVAG